MTTGVAASLVRTLRSIVRIESTFLVPYPGPSQVMPELCRYPRYPVYNDDGSFNNYIGGTNGVFGTANLVQELTELERKQTINNVLSNGYLEFTFLKILNSELPLMLA